MSLELSWHIFLKVHGLPVTASGLACMGIVLDQTDPAITVLTMLLNVV